MLKGASGVGAMKKKEKKPGKEGERKRSALEEIREVRCGQKSWKKTDFFFLNMQFLLLDLEI